MLITGASSGIGKALAIKMSHQGASRIILASRRLEELEKVRKECADPSKVECWTVDLSKPTEAMERAKDLKLDRLDVLVNNGGVSLRAPFVNSDLASAQTLMNTNFTSHIALIKAFTPQLQASKGSIVNVSSVAGLLGAGCRTTYSASKFAIAGFAKALRAEMAEDGVKVINIYPGYI